MKYFLTYFLGLILPFTYVKASTDITVTASSHFTEVRNDVFEYSPTLINTGTEVIDTVIARAYFSLDGQLSADDELLDSALFTNLSAGDRREFYTELSFNRDPGEYYLILHAETPGKQDINSEDNELASVLILENKEVDLVAEEIELITKVLSKGMSAEIRMNLREKGSVIYNDQVSTELFLSQDAVWDEGDHSLGEHSQVKTASGRINNEIDVVVEIPADFPGEEAYLIQKISYFPSDGIDETDKSNNISKLKVKLLEPNFNVYVDGVRGKHLIESIQYNYNVWVDLPNENNAQDMRVFMGNNGNISADTVTMTFCQSRDPFYDASDPVMFVDTFSLGANSTDVWSLPEDFDLSVLDDTYPYVVFLIGSKGEMTSTDNQIFVEFVRSEPSFDLFYRHISMKGVAYEPMWGAYPLEYVEVSKKESLAVEIMTLVIEDSTFSKPIEHEVGIYFSEDSRLKKSEDAELLITSLRAPSLGPAYLEVPLDKIEDPEGYIIVVIDPDNNLPEYTRNNNSVAFPITVSHLSAIRPFPNPFNERIHLTDVSEGYALYNMFGKKVMQGWNTDQIDASHLSAGVYFLELSEGTRFKVVKD